MTIYDDCVLLTELYKKAKVSESLFYQLKDVDIEYMGNIPILRIKQLPSKYKKIALTCTNLKNYSLYTYLSIDLGMNRDYLNCMEHQGLRKFESIRIERYKLFKLSDEFITFIKRGMTPFIIRPSNKDFATQKIQMQGLKIGFY